MSASDRLLHRPRLALRRKGEILFALVSLYVIAGALVIAAEALELTKGADLAGRVAPLVAAALVVLLLGLVIFGVFLTLFLGRLAADLACVQERALQVAAGYRGPPLVLARNDEVGSLADAVDKMAEDLKARETRIAVAQVEQFHNERMTVLGGVAAGLAHEIGNPAAAIAAIASAGVCAGDPVRSAEARQLQVLAERLGATVRRLALAAGLRSKTRGATALNAVLESLLPLIALDARFRTVEIVTVLDPALALVEIAEDDFVQVLLHLLVNAVESLDPTPARRPLIRVVTANEVAGVRISVSDNGRGMDAGLQARAFEPLFTTKPGGNGLGLDACRRIVERHGGAIQLDSAPGEGTTVTIRLPFARSGSAGSL